MSDGLASSAKSFLVTVRAGDARLTIKGVSAQEVELTLNCPPNHQNVVEFSNDLINWTPLSILVSATGSVEFTDLNAHDAQQRFYRARQAD